MNTIQYVASQPLTHALMWFIENVPEGDPERTAAFFVLRERVRNEGTTADAAPAMLAALKVVQRQCRVYMGVLEFDEIAEAVTDAVDSAEGR